MRTSRRLQPTLNQTTSQKHRLWYGLAVTGVVLVAGIFATMNWDDTYLNDGETALTVNQSQFIGLNFINDTLATWQNEGEIFFQGDVLNNGTMNCGTCNTGSNFINNFHNHFQTIEANLPIQMGDVVLENTSGASLSGELIVVNSLLFEKGVLSTDRNDLQSFVHFQAGALHSGANSQRHIDGYSAWTGGGNFTLPTGHSLRYSATGIETATSNDFAKAAYFYRNPGQTNIPAGAPFNPLNMSSDVMKVHTKEFWDVDGSTNTKVTLSWDGQSDVPNLVSQMSEIAVGGWDGSQWVSLGQTDLQGSLSQGSVSSGWFTPNDYAAVTLVQIPSTNALPVEWLEFTARLKNGHGILDWVTGAEINSLLFDVERSLDGRTFEQIGSKQAAGFSDMPLYYSFIDSNVVTLGVNRFYYRIRQEDLDGQSEYSRIVELNLQALKEHVHMTIFPNPTTDFVQVRLESSMPLDAQLEMFNMAGQIVHHEPLSGGQERRINLAKFAEGTYVVRVVYENEQISKKLVVHK
ncbi:MAG: T9SS type A sorting domain-containing protein [Bacteroidota bacterium]